MLALAISLRQSNKIHGLLKNRARILDTGGSVQKWQQESHDIQLTHKLKGVPHWLRGWGNQIPLGTSG